MENKSETNSEGFLLKKIKISHSLLFSSGSQSCFCLGESGNPRLFIIVLKQLFFGTSSQKTVFGSTNKYRKNLGNESRMLHGGLIADLIVLEIGHVFENVTYS